MVLPFFPADLLLWNCGSGRGRRTQRGKCPPPDSDLSSDAEFDKNLACLSRPAYRKRVSPLCSSTKAVSFSSKRTFSRSPKSNRASRASASVRAQDDSYTRVTRYQVLP